MTNEGYLKSNNNEHWEVNGIELKPGSKIEIQIDEYWICGVIENWNDGFYWFSQKNGVPVILHSGIRARLPLTTTGGAKQSN